MVRVAANVCLSGDFARARDLASKAAEIATKAKGPRSDTVGYARETLCYAALQEGKYAEAQKECEQSVAILRETENTKGAGALLDLAEVLMATKQYAGALTASMEAAQRYEKSSPVNANDVARARVHVGEAQLALGKPDEARASFEKAIALCDPEPCINPPTYATARLGIARVLIGERQPGKALALLREAREATLKLPESFLAKKSLAEVERLLKKAER
jgi:tetratricopeptide (TPR) repeat protein